ncbi:hypothetical protein O181_035920 [Austropuccinia psidii MF-1]|uniref:Delta 8-(E)-sphingolipid desaturase n=1 Tax=Austropuccinia psidii MF-1 TaxID=1389203 RepID=A0A9Q3D7V7_9BASI|nr:hypothetical protein [Austropuccinia psidii MF-1]
MSDSSYFDGLYQDSSIPILTRDQIKLKIALGDVLVIHRSLVYKLNSWLNNHPGGQLSILHFVGRDATDEIEAYHPINVIKFMKPFIIARINQDHIINQSFDLIWRPLNPPIQVGLWPMTPLKSIDNLMSFESNFADCNQSSPSTSSSIGDLSILDSSSLSPSQTSNNSQGSCNSSSNSTLINRLHLLEPSSNQSQRDHDLSLERQKQLSLSYRALHDQIRAAGLYRAPQPFFGYGPDMIRYAILFTLFFLTSPLYYHSKKIFQTWFLNTLEPPILIPPSTLRCFISAIFLGLYWHQITFVGHDAGHSGITGDWKTDRLIGIFVGNFLCGLSIGWWCDNHDVHHLVTNHPEHDPDIQHLPFFAISTKFFQSLRSTYYKHTMRFNKFATSMVKHQHRFYYVIMFFARFNLLFNSYIYIAQRKEQRMRNLEIFGIIAFWFSFIAFLYLLPSNWIRVMFVLVSFGVTSPLHVQIVLSHFAQSTQDLGLNESFAHRQIRTTMDVTCPPWLDFLHGGLHMQVTHHLFPRLPRHQLRFACEKFVRPWCQKEGLSYQSFKFVDGNLKVLGVLQDVANQVKVLKLVALAQAKGEIH